MSLVLRMDLNNELIWINWLSWLARQIKAFLSVCIFVFFKHLRAHCCQKLKLVLKTAVVYWRDKQELSEAERGTQGQSSPLVGTNLLRQQSWKGVGEHRVRGCLLRWESHFSSDTHSSWSTKSKVQTWKKKHIKTHVWRYKLVNYNL